MSSLDYLKDMMVSLIWNYREGFNLASSETVEFFWKYKIVYVSCISNPSLRIPNYHPDIGVR